MLAFCRSKYRTTFRGESMCCYGVCYGVVMVLLYCQHELERILLLAYIHIVNSQSSKLDPVCVKHTSLFRVFVCLYYKQAHI